LSRLEPRIISQFRDFISGQKLKLSQLVAQKKQDVEQTPTEGRLLIMLRKEVRVTIEEKLQRAAEIDKLFPDFIEKEKDIVRLTDPNPMISRPTTGMSNYDKSNMLLKEISIILPQLYSEVAAYAALYNRIVGYYSMAARKCTGDQIDVYVVDQTETCSAVHLKLTGYRIVLDVLSIIKPHLLKLNAKITNFYIEVENHQANINAVKALISKGGMNLTGRQSINRPQYLKTLQDEFYALLQKSPYVGNLFHGAKIKYISIDQMNRNKSRTTAVRSSPNKGSTLQMPRQGLQNSVQSRQLKL